MGDLFDCASVRACSTFARAAVADASWQTCSCLAFGDFLYIKKSCRGRSLKSAHREVACMKRLISFLNFSALALATKRLDLRCAPVLELQDSQFISVLHTL